MANHDIVVMGASDGGVEAFAQFVSYLPEKFPAAIFIVQHLSPNAPSFLHQILSRAGPLPAIIAQHGKRIEPGAIYIAPPNQHLVLKNDHMILTLGPRVNRVRPSIDVLFRSAAAFHTTRVVAALLTGYSDDGVGGLSAVKRCGGIIIVQNPSEAKTSELPQTAIDTLSVDYVLSLRQIATKVGELAKKPAGRPLEVPEDIMEEIKVSEHNVPDLDRMERIGERSTFTCPECGGMLWKLKDEPIPRYSCHTGHSFTDKSFLNGNAEVIEYSIWSAVRLLQERAKLLQNMAEEARKNGRLKAGEEYKTKAEDFNYHARILRDFLVSGKLLASKESSVE